MSGQRKHDGCIQHKCQSISVLQDTQVAAAPTQLQTVNPTEGVLPLLPLATCNPSSNPGPLTH